MTQQMELTEAAALVTSSSTIALGGMILYRRPIAFVKALLKRYRVETQPVNLTLIAFTAGMESDLLVGTGMVSNVRSCYFGLEIFGLAPMFTYFANHGMINIIEETEASLAFGLRAQMAGIGFMPGRGWIGTDLPKLRPDVKTIQDPYTGEELIAFPAISTDIAVVHALRADKDGNAQIGDNKGIDLELALIAKTLIITAEEVVPYLEKADIVAPLVDVLVHAPSGALPTSCHPLYPMDGANIMAYSEAVSDPDSFQRFLTGWL